MNFYQHSPEQINQLADALALKQGEQVAPYTGDVARIMREAGMTFHLGLPHKAVVEQMTRVVDLVYAEASIKAAVAFAAPKPPVQADTAPTAWAILSDDGTAAKPQRHIDVRGVAPRKPKKEKV